MRLVALYAIATLIALALETTIPLWLPIGVLTPNLILILAVDLGMKHHGALGAIIAFAMGYAIDSFSGTHLGLNAFMLTLTYVIAYGMSRYLISTSSAIGVIVVLMGAIITGLANSLDQCWARVLVGRARDVAKVGGQRGGQCVIGAVGFRLNEHGETCGRIACATSARVNSSHKSL